MNLKTELLSIKEAELKDLGISQSTHIAKIVNTKNWPRDRLIKMNIDMSYKLN